MSSLEHALARRRRSSPPEVIKIEKDAASPVVHAHPHLTTAELCDRWRCAPETLSRNYRKWGLRPMLIAGAHLWPLDQIEEYEHKSMKK